MIGGAPTCSKTWLGLDLALSVATGTACLGNYAVPEPGPVLVYLELVATDAETTHLEVVAALHGHRQRNLQDEARALLAHGAVFTRAKLRDALSVKNERLGEALTSLQEAGRIRRTAAGWQRVN